MRTSDEMIFVLSLYNKMKDANPAMPERTLAANLTAACERLVQNGDIKAQSYKDCLYALFASERRKVVEQIEKEAVTKAQKEESVLGSPYSTTLNRDKIKSLTETALGANAHKNKSIDQILSDFTHATPSESRSFDPCGHGGGYRSSC